MNEKQQKLVGLLRSAKKWQKVVDRFKIETGEDVCLNLTSYGSNYQVFSENFDLLPYEEYHSKSGNLHKTALLNGTKVDWVLDADHV